MLPVYICDDIKEEVQYIKKIIEGIDKVKYKVKIVCTVSDPHCLLDYLNTHRTQSLYFIDIDLKNDINGIELAKEIRKIDPRAFIVIVTTHDEMTRMTFEYMIEAMDFIIKSIYMENRIEECVINACNLFNSQGNIKEKTICFFKDKKEITLKLEDIYSIENIKNKSHRLKIRLKTGIIEMSGTLNDIEKSECNELFRCNKSIIINIRHVCIIDFEKREAVLDDGITYLISRRKMNKLKEIVSLNKNSS